MSNHHDFFYRESFESDVSLNAIDVAVVESFDKTR